MENLGLVGFTGAGANRLFSALTGIPVPSEYEAAVGVATVPDERVSVSTENALATCEEVMATNGLFIGHSAGAAVFAAREQARALRGGVVVALLCDGGERYLSGRR